MAAKTKVSLQESLISAISHLVFSFLDLLDFLLCFFYRFIDGILEENPGQCYCQNTEKQGSDESHGVSETLYGRRNIFRATGLRWFAERTNEGQRGEGLRSHRWSDCGCERCTSWQGKGEMRLHTVVMEPASGIWFVLCFIEVLVELCSALTWCSTALLFFCRYWKLKKFI